MRVAIRISGTTVTLEWEPEGGDSLQHRHARLVGRSARVVLPVAVSRADIHPDVEALLATLIVSPFSETMTFERGVSRGFAAAVRTRLGKTAQPVDPGLEPRRAPSSGRVGLAFSGGSDSSAALAVLPPDTLACFMNRLPPPDGQPAGPFSTSAQLHACEVLARQGWPVVVASSDVVHVRQPVGFTTDWVNAAPLLLMAEAERIDSVGWGLNSHAAYLIGHVRYVDWAARQEDRWGSLFAAAGLPMANAVAGLSNVCTASIVHRWEHGDLVQSCQFGDVGRPCGACWKCFRARLLHGALTGDWPADSEIDALASSKQSRRILTQFPIQNENAVAWALRSYRGSHPLLRQLVVRTRADRSDLGWLERFYGPSLDLVGEPHREVLRERLGGYLEPMTAVDEERMRAWDMTAFLADPATRSADDTLRLMLGRRARRPKSHKPRRSVARRLLASLRGGRQH